MWCRSVKALGAVLAPDSPADPSDAAAGNWSDTLSHIMLCGLLLPGRGEAR
jgi:hypothetical protein